MQDFEAATDELKKLRNLISIFSETVDKLPEGKQDQQINEVLHQFSIIDLETIENALDQLESIVADKASNLNLDSLKKQLQIKDNKINEFKLSLADSVMEFKELSRRYSEVLDKNKQLQKEVSHLQMITKDTQLKLSTAQKNYSTTDELLKKANEELYENKSKLYNLQGNLAEIEDQLEEHKKNLQASNELIQVKQNELNKTRKKNNDLESSYNSLKIQHSALEERMDELESTIDMLQKDKDRLQKKLDQFLTGLPSSFTYSVKTADQKGEAALEPLRFAAYLPFCFPERLPAIRHFKRQIRKSFAKNFERIQKKPPQIMNQADDIELPEEKLRVLFNKISFNCPAPEKFAQPLPLIKPDKAQLSPVLKIRLHKSVEMNETFEQTLLPVSFSRLRFSSLQPPGRLELPENHKFMIDTNSLGLLLSYLSRNIIEANYLELKHHEKFLETLTKQLYKPELGHKIIIFDEKLAFRYRFHLKSHRLILERQKLNFSFRRGSGLKSVLKTFENTISSMVNKYDIFAKKPSEKS